MASILNYFKLSSEKKKDNSDTEIEVLEIDKQATSEQPCSSSATGDLDRVNSDCEDLSDQDCEVPEDPSASASSVSEPPCKQRKLHDFMDSWTKSRPWLRYDNEAKVMYCDWCLQSKKKNPFTTDCRNFRTSTLDRHVSLPGHKEVVQDITLRKEFQS